MVLNFLSKNSDLIIEIVLVFVAVFVLFKFVDIFNKHFKEKILSKQSDTTILGFMPIVDKVLKLTIVFLAFATVDRDAARAPWVSDRALVPGAARCATLQEVSRGSENPKPGRAINSTPFFSHHSTSFSPICFALVLTNLFWSRNLYHSCNAASTVMPLGTTLPSVKSFRRFSSSLTFDCASDQLRVAKDHLFW